MLVVAQAINYPHEWRQLEQKLRAVLLHRVHDQELLTALDYVMDVGQRRERRERSLPAGSSLTISCPDSQAFNRRRTPLLLTRMPDVKTGGRVPERATWRLTLANQAPEQQLGIYVIPTDTDIQSESCLNLRITVLLIVVGFLFVVGFVWFLSHVNPSQALFAVSFENW